MHCMSTEFGVDSSSRFSFRASTQMPLITLAQHLLQLCDLYRWTSHHDDTLSISFSHSSCCSRHSNYIIALCTAAGPSTAHATHRLKALSYLPVKTCSS